MININDKFNVLFNNMSEGVALHSYVYDQDGKVVNYVIDDVNSAFEKILNLKKKDVVGKLATEVFQVSEAPYLKEYTASHKDYSGQFDVYFAPLKKYFHISVSMLGKDGFATIFFDITNIKKTEAELKEKNENLENSNSLMVDRELKMVELKNELKNKTKK
jgi:PAS domain-containing protein